MFSFITKLAEYGKSIVLLTYQVDSQKSQIKKLQEEIESLNKICMDLKYSTQSLRDWKIEYESKNKTELNDKLGNFVEKFKNLENKQEEFEKRMNLNFNNFILQVKIVIMENHKDQVDRDKSSQVFPIQLLPNSTSHNESKDGSNN